MRLVFEDDILNVDNIIKFDGVSTQKSYSISTDSRSIHNGEAFIALKGERFDGLDYIEQAIKSKSPVIIYNYSEVNYKRIKKVIQNGYSGALIGAENTLDYLQKLSKLHLTRWKKSNRNRKVVAITGSNGKTTTKDMLFHILERLKPGKVCRTLGNLNNHIGVPLTLLSLKESDELLIIEIGSNHIGEIKFLCDLVGPEYGFITNIGQSHLEFFNTKQNVFKEKKALYDYITDVGNNGRFFLINYDDCHLKNLKLTEKCRTFGVNSSDYKLNIQEDNRFSISFDNHSITVLNRNIVGKHNLINLASSIIISFSVLEDINYQLIIDAAEKFMPFFNRSSLIVKDDKLFFMDAYNANPSSMKVAIESFISRCKKERGYSINNCLFILGDMNELGKHSNKLHESIGKYLSELKVHNVAFVGKFCKSYKKGFGQDCEVFNNKQELMKRWNNYKDKFKFFFFKGSRSLQLETLMDIR